MEPGGVSRHAILLVPGAGTGGSSPFLFAFPAELSLNPVNWYGPPDAVPVLLRVEDPVQHFLYHFDLDDVRLADYIIEPRTGIP